MAAYISCIRREGVFFPIVVVSRGFDHLLALGTLAAGLRCAFALFLFYGYFREVESGGGKDKREYSQAKRLYLLLFSICLYFFLPFPSRRGD